MSRREFLKISSASLVSLLAISPPSYAYAESLLRQEGIPTMGRITKNGVNLYESASLDGKVVRTLWQDLVLPITQTTISSGEPLHNQVWYELNGEGFVHSGTVQPVEIRLNPALSAVPEKGLLAEVTVPYTDASWNPIFPKMVAYRLYYSTTHWILNVIQDSHGETWYELLEDFYRFRYYVPASHMRVIPAQEVTTLSPNVPENEKRIEVHLNDQIVIAFEGDSQVQLLRCSGGMKYYDHYLTPTGTFTTDYKRPSRHMVDGSKVSANSYDLPGVPWVSFIDENGISFHGTYWHNDFGRPRSHGCINLPSAGAKWVYRWTLPNVPYEEQIGYRRGGTRIDISIL
ncbi:MAG: L,D-transpeptidase [Chloroflexi bacterium]|nr:L,D-transpeptidase [Chloroflexota bacterium]